MKLYIARHGDAVSEQEDSLRPLSQFGKAQLERVAKKLQERNVSVENIFHSGKRRAQETAAILAGCIGNGKVEYLAGILPDDSVEHLIEVSWTWEADTMVVGHLPFVQDFIYGLTQKKELVAFPTATVACLEKVRGIGWRLLWVEVS